MALHRDILRARPDAGAVVHTHSTFATVLAIARKNPSCHYMIGLRDDPLRRLRDLRHAGTVGQRALQALEGRNGCLLANHGTIAISQPR
jgi:L-fuculose-phosphate aldolase